MTTAKTLRQGQDSFYTWQDTSTTVSQSWHQPDPTTPHTIVGGGLQFIMDVTIPTLTDGNGAEIDLFFWYDIRRPDTASSQSRTALLVTDCQILIGSLLTGSANPTLSAGVMATALQILTATGDGSKIVKVANLTLPVGVDSTTKSLSWGSAVPTPQVMGRRTIAFGGGTGAYLKTGLQVQASGGNIGTGNVRVIVEAYET